MFRRAGRAWVDARALGAGRGDVVAWVLVGDVAGSGPVVEVCSLLGGAGAAGCPAVALLAQPASSTSAPATAASRFMRSCYQPARTIRGKIARACQIEPADPDHVFP
jgi:hypothetical protein